MSNETKLPLDNFHLQLVVGLQEDGQTLEMFSVDGKIVHRLLNGDVDALGWLQALADCFEKKPRHCVVKSPIPLTSNEW